MADPAAFLLLQVVRQLDADFQGQGPRGEGTAASTLASYQSDRLESRNSGSSIGSSTVISMCRLDQGLTLPSDCDMMVHLTVPPFTVPPRALAEDDLPGTPRHSNRPT